MTMVWFGKVAKTKPLLLLLVFGLFPPCESRLTGTGGTARIEKEHEGGDDVRELTIETLPSLDSIDGNDRRINSGSGGNEGEEAEGEDPTFQILQQQPEEIDNPPNIIDVTYSYNAFLGKTPAEQRQSFVGIQMFSVSGTRTGTVGNALYNQPEQVQDMFVGERCDYRGISDSIWWSTSSELLSQQTESSSHGFDQEVDLEGSYKGVTASTSIRNALVFGNSQTTMTARQRRDSGYTYSFDGHSKRLLYGIEIDYGREGTNNDDDDDVMADSWTDNFLERCEGLGSSPTLQMVLEFFRTVGTHGLATASFGQQCTVTAFMEGGQSYNAYQNFHQSSSSYEVGFLWWQSSGSQSESSYTDTDSTFGFSYAFDNRRCEGTLQYDSPCGGNMPGGGFNHPTIVEWSYIPIYDMDIPTLADTAKTKMKETFGIVLEAANRCSQNHCNGQGACATSSSIWNNAFTDDDDDGNNDNVIADESDLDLLFDTGTCFCEDGYVGRRCDKGRPVALRNPATSPNYLNSYDQPVSIQQNGDPLCGMTSIHHNHYEDRRFQAKTCSINEPMLSTNARAMQQTLTTDYRQTFTMLCDRDKVLTVLSSAHSNHQEDRRWTGTCTHFQSTKVDQDTCAGFDITQPSANGYENEYDQPVDFTCPSGTVLVGVHSIYHGSYRDRRWAFRCCGLTIEPGFSEELLDENVFPIALKRSGKCLDHQGNLVSGGGAHLWDCHGEAQSLWNYDVSTRQVVSVSGLCLDASPPHQNGAVVRMWQCDTSNDNQRWEYDASAKTLRNHGYCLDAHSGTAYRNGGRVQLWSCHGGTNQQWYMGTKSSGFTARLCKHSNCQGGSYVGSFGNWPEMPEEIGNDALSRVHIGSNVVFSYYEHSRFGGWTRTYGPNVNLNMGGHNDAVSSFMIRLLPDEQVKLCRHSDCSGGGVYYANRPGSWGSMPGVIGNDALSRVYIPQGWSFTYYEHGNFGGWQRTFGSCDNAINLNMGGHNDAVSSFRVALAC